MNTHSSLLGGTAATVYATITPDGGWADLMHSARSVGVGVGVWLVTSALTLVAKYVWAKLAPAKGK